VANVATAISALVLLGVSVWPVSEQATANGGASAERRADIVIDGKFDTSTEHVLIPVTIAGHQFWCSPDSGFSALIALDQAKAVAAGIAVAPPIPTPDGNPPRPGDNSATATVVVGGVTFANQSLILRRFPEEAPDMDCVMGIALPPLRQFVVEYEHITPRLILRDRASYKPPSGTETITLQFLTNPSVPYIDIEIAFADGSTQPLHVLPDTGTAFYGGLVVGSAAARLTSKAATAPVVLYNDARITRILAARPAAVRAGAITVQNLVVAVIEGSLGADGAISNGTLGEGFLRRFTVGFDFEGRKMYLKPNERVSQPHLFDASGVAFIRRDGRHVVYGVIPNTPAADAGIQVGDVLTSVDDRPASDLTTVQLRNQLSEDGATRRLVFERAGAVIQRVLRLRARI
jgi:hypothetical protein